MKVIQWCGNCNSEPAKGTLHIEDPDEDELIELQVCLGCAQAIARNANTDLSAITQ